MDGIVMLSETTATTVETVTSALTSALTTTANDMLSAIGSVLPKALTVAGAILVVTLGWRLFRNFTHG